MLSAGAPTTSRSFLIPKPGSKEPENAWDAFNESWVRIFGCPEIIVCDPGSEFRHLFCEKAAGEGGIVLPTDARAPWQNGKTERAGKEWKAIFKIALRKFGPENYKEWRALGLAVNASRNRYNNRSGFSPMQRVFGFNTRLPASLTSDDVIDPVYMYDNASSDFKRSVEIRNAATRAWAALDSRDRLRKGLKARHRLVENFTEGDMVYVWRQGRVGAGRYVGPGVVVIASAGGAWVNMRGGLWRCANEQLRKATNEESLGVELVNRYLGHMKDSLRNRRGQRSYVDVIVEGTPRLDEAHGEEELEQLYDLPDEPLVDREQDPWSNPEARKSLGQHETLEIPPQSSADVPMGPQVSPPSEPSASRAPSKTTPGTSRAPSKASPSTNVELGFPPSLPPPPEGMQAQKQARDFVKAEKKAPKKKLEQAGTVSDASKSSVAKRSRSMPPTTKKSVGGTVPDSPPQVHVNYYLHHKFQDKPEEVDLEQDRFVIEDADARWCEKSQCFYVYRKKRPGEEIDTSKLPGNVTDLWTNKDHGARVVEWSKLQKGGPLGPAIKVWRGEEARKLREEFGHRIVNSRWHEKWKDMGDDFDNGLNERLRQSLSNEDLNVTANVGAKSRWIIQGFTDPDLALLNRTVPTPTSEDVMMALQLIASIKGAAGISDVSSAFGQSIKGLRKERLFANPPKEGLP